MASSSERPYAEDDLTGSNKASLIKFVQRQIARWPGPGNFQPSKVTVPQIKAALLDPSYGFTTNQAPISSPHPLKARHHESAQVIPPKESSPSVASEIASERRPQFWIVQQRYQSARVLCKDLLSALQKSNAAVEIPSTGSETVRISFPDPEDEEWKVPFVRIPHGQSWELSHFDPEALHIPETRRLKLHIDHPWTIDPLSAPTPAQPSQSKEDDTDPAVKFLKTSSVPGTVMSPSQLIVDAHYQTLRLFETGSSQSLSAQITISSKHQLSALNV
ncbi:hypothetical protein B0H14DRAFT_2578390 [Mycena olivaceomarginata]|nr:hypothetical protein B0H14DRAFT_2606993 [Mycena olivaceomarginata]KAJ7857505.1 hypothetical protein B0H14DRAFT_2578390 [Mycena olivaceomarginata]